MLGPKLSHKLDVFLQSSVWPCWWSSVADHPILFAKLSSARRWFWLGLKCLVAFKHSFPDMVIKRIKVWWVWWSFVFSDSHCSWWQSSFEPASPCEQVLRPAGKWNQMVKAICNLQPIWATRFHSKVYHSLLPYLEWNAVFLFRHSSHQQRPWRAWQISSSPLPGAFCRNLKFKKILTT